MTAASFWEKELHSPAVELQRTSNSCFERILYMFHLPRSACRNLQRGSHRFGKGTAVVTMPAWFEALNTEFRYQLTVVGQFGQAIVASEITNGTFIINTSKPGMKVSCQVTGIRQDAWANAHRIQVEVDNAPSPYFPAAYAGNKCI
jgi:hypothetical protein